MSGMSDNAPQPRTDDAPARLDPADVPEAARLLRAVAAAVERGELDASPVMLSRLTGALDVLDALDPT